MTAGPSGSPRRRVGLLGESLAAQYLVSRGYSIVARNWRTRTGEIDIIATTGDWLVFVEVRARRRADDAFEPTLGVPEESVTRRKQAQLIALAEAYLFEHVWNGPWRIDVLALEIGPGGALLRLRHLQDAVSG